MKQYLGDGAYVDFDGFSLILTTDDGVRDTNIIVLEPEVYAALVRYVDALRAGTEAESLDA
jgi:hypothetical protein